MRHEINDFFKQPFHPDRNTLDLPPEESETIRTSIKKMIAQAPSSPSNDDDFSSIFSSTFSPIDKKRSRPSTDTLPPIISKPDTNSSLSANLSPTSDDKDIATQPLNSAKTPIRNRLRKLIKPFVLGLTLAGLSSPSVSPLNNGNHDSISNDGNTHQIGIEINTNPTSSSSIVDQNPSNPAEDAKFAKLEPGETFYEFLCRKADKKIPHESPASMSAIMNAASDYLQSQGKEISQYINLDTLYYFQAKEPIALARIINQIRLSGIRTPSDTEIVHLDLSAIPANSVYENFVHHLWMYFVDIDQSNQFYEILYQAKQNLNKANVDEFSNHNAKRNTSESLHGSNINLKVLETQQESLALTNPFRESNQVQSDDYQFNPEEFFDTGNYDQDDEPELLTDVIKEPDDGQIDARDFFGIDGDNNSLNLNANRSVSQIKQDDEPELLTDVVKEPDDGQIGARDFFEIGDETMTDSKPTKNDDKTIATKNSFALAASLQETRKKGSLFRSIASAISGFFKSFRRKKT
ncbi:hypothetical protein A2272_01865 [Candidatus Peregrinibacteria bacterium RIFOXYA12_FULL_33_12]|nr:MAG: hypothetical protein A2272_01865 [Candidatus Peregrinibacteria bacterium RIFOXYA12_FULL_33_12]